MRKNIKVSHIGGISCLGCIALGFALINPLAVVATYAKGNDVVGEEAVSDGEDISSLAETALTQSETIASTVNFAFSNPIGVTSLTPISTDGASAQYSIQATVDVENSGGYAVYLGAENSNLVGKQSGVTIPPVTAQSTYENLPINSWGYNATEGTSAAGTFQAISINNRGTIIGSNNSTNIKYDRKTFTLSFATRIGIDKPADIYENKVTLSVVSSPLEVTSQTLYDFGITSLQAMTPAICANAPVGATAQLIDTRSDTSQKYWVTKLADNNCWMTQNLDLDVVNELGSGGTDSDWNWNRNSTYPPVSTYSSITSSNINATPTSTRSWDYGLYVLANPETASSCGSGKSGASACPTQFLAVGSRVASPDPDFYLRSNYAGTSGGSCNKPANSPLSTATSGECAQYDAHYTIGNQYQWNSATVGTGGTITNSQARFSICPENWKLPTSNTTDNGSFGALIASGEINSDVTKLTAAPYFFVRGGASWQDNDLYGNAGDQGFYWSSTASSGANGAYALEFSGNNNINASSSRSRQHGLSVRCVAR